MGVIMRKQQRFDAALLNLEQSLFMEWQLRGGSASGGRSSAALRDSDMSSAAGPAEMMMPPPQPPLLQQMGPTEAGTAAAQIGNQNQKEQVVKQGEEQGAEGEKTDAQAAEGGGASGPDASALASSEGVRGGGGGGGGGGGMLPSPSRAAATDLAAEAAEAATRATRATRPVCCDEVAATLCEIGYAQYAMGENGRARHYLYQVRNQERNGKKGRYSRLSVVCCISVSYRHWKHLYLMQKSWFACAFYIYIVHTALQRGCACTNICTGWTLPPIWTWMWAWLVSSIASGGHV
jgi:hypothetical protein